MNNSTDKYIHATLNIPLWNVEKNRSYTISNFASDVKKFLRQQMGDSYRPAVIAQGQKLTITIE